MTKLLGNPLKYKTVPVGYNMKIQKFKEAYKKITESI